MNGPFLVSSCALLGRDAGKCCTCITVYVCIILLLLLSPCLSASLPPSPCLFFLPGPLFFSLFVIFSFVLLSLSRSLSLSPLFRTRALSLSHTPTLVACTCVHVRSAEEAPLTVMFCEPQSTQKMKTRHWMECGLGESRGASTAVCPPRRRT